MVNINLPIPNQSDTHDPNDYVAFSYFDQELNRMNFWLIGQGDDGNTYAIYLNSCYFDTYRIDDNIEDFLEEMEIEYSHLTCYGSTDQFEINISEAKRFS